MIWIKKNNHSYWRPTMTKWQNNSRKLTPWNALNRVAWSDPAQPAYIWSVNNSGLVWCDIEYGTIELYSLWKFITDNIEDVHVQKNCWFRQFDIETVESMHACLSLNGSHMDNAASLPGDNPIPLSELGYYLFNYSLAQILWHWTNQCLLFCWFSWCFFCFVFSVLLCSSTCHINTH